VGSATHLNAERFRLGAGYRQGELPLSPEALTEIVTGRVRLLLLPGDAVLPLLKDGKIVALAVQQQQALARVPDLRPRSRRACPTPTTTSGSACSRPRGLRKKRDRLYQETAKALHSEQVREKMARLGAEPMDYNPSSQRPNIREEDHRHRGVVKAAGIKSE